MYQADSTAVVEAAIPHVEDNSIVESARKDTILSSQSFAENVRQKSDNQLSDAATGHNDSVRSMLSSADSNSAALTTDSFAQHYKDSVHATKDLAHSHLFDNLFHSNDSALHTTVGSGKSGVVGEPLPYSVKSDYLVTGMLIGCFMMALVAFSHSKRFFRHQFKYFFYEPQNGITEASETSNEIRFQLLFVLQTCVLLSVIYFFYTTECVANTFILDTNAHLIGIFLGVFVLYFIFKALIYCFVNWLFFERRSNERWMKSFVFIASLEGMLIFPLVLLLSYFNLSFNNATLYMAIVIILIKLLSFYKCFIIFFKRKGAFLQIFLYFCTLEIVPLLSLWGILTMIVDQLKINY